VAYVVSIDAGTTGVRSLVVDEHGQVVDLSYRALTMHYPQPGWVEQEPEEIWESVAVTLCEVGARLAESGGEVAAIGITNQRETALAWDRATGRPLHRAIVWQDRRTAGRCDELRAAGHLPLVRRRTGLVLDPYFSATKWAAILQAVGDGTGGTSAGTGAGTGAGMADLALGTVDTWVLWHLTGGPHGGLLATDPTNASRTLLYDINELAWSDELCDLFGVPRQALGEVLPSCGSFGRVAPGALGDRRGATPLTGVTVSGIAGDQQSALFGQACFEPAMAKVTYGTGSFVLANAGHRPPAIPDGLVATVAWDLGGHAGRGPSAGAREIGAPAVTYALEGSAFVSGAAIGWLRDGLGLIEASEELGPLAASVPDSGGVTFVPAFTGLGSPWWDPRARGTVTGITRGTGRAQLARAVVEAMAFQVRDMVDAMAAATGRPVSALRADGGASAMDLLLQLQADQVQAPVARPRSVESTALGAAMLAGLAEGVWTSLDELAGLWSVDLEHVPQASREAADAAHATWLRAVERSRDWADG